MILIRCESNYLYRFSRCINNIPIWKIREKEYVIPGKEFIEHKKRAIYEPNTFTMQGLVGYNNWLVASII